MGNRERIVNATIELMNKHGSTIGTTQLTKHLNISPSNLYYHFRNREEILDEVLSRLQADLEDCLFVDPKHETSPQQLAAHLWGGGDVLWRYRFFFSASLELVIGDLHLSERYREFSKYGIQAASTIIKNTVRTAPSDIRLSPSERQSIAENIWVLWTSWPRFSEVLSGHGPARKDIDKGVDNIALLLKPYLAKSYFNKMRRNLRRPT